MLTGKYPILLFNKSIMNPTNHHTNSKEKLETVIIHNYVKQKSKLSGYKVSSAKTH